jgi:hypothetical protein
MRLGNAGTISAVTHVAGVDPHAAVKRISLLEEGYDDWDKEIKMKLRKSDGNN